MTSIACAWIKAEHHPQIIIQEVLNENHKVTSFYLEMEEQVTVDRMIEKIC